MYSGCNGPGGGVSSCIDDFEFYSKQGSKNDEASIGTYGESSVCAVQNIIEVNTDSPVAPSPQKSLVFFIRSIDLICSLHILITIVSEINRVKTHCYKTT